MNGLRVERGLRGRLLHDEPLSRHTSWRVGGPADRYYEPADLEDLALFLRGLPPEEPLLWLGLGSNLLVRDGGVRGTVIATAGVLGGMRILADGTVEAGCGLACAQLARRCAREGRGGLEFMAGIPGTVGGALRLNAGAHGGETWQRVIEVELIDRSGERQRRPGTSFEVGYREVALPQGQWFVTAWLRTDPRPREEGEAMIRELLARRGSSQPMGRPSCGSVFRNPPGDHAARLIESCGLKGLRRGGAEVSTRHANFIINRGDATAADIEALIHEVRRRVREGTGIELVPEVHIVGEAGPEVAS
ncbi:MAG: UDP-N-acetylmuramate dehydrogenase [Gammaproteobacteria bacterium]|nr:MAG: UDP-N-acetylmuramate dehydrogenase [Gammaproteobacteria bacterium]